MVLTKFRYFGCTWKGEKGRGLVEGRGKDVKRKRLDGKEGEIKEGKGKGVEGRNKDAEYVKIKLWKYEKVKRERKRTKRREKRRERMKGRDWKR